MILGKIAREILRPFDRLLRLLFCSWLRKLDGGAFCLFFNVRSFLFCRIKKVKLRHEPENGIFQAIGADARVAMFSPAQILAMYSRGVECRIQSLAATYFLPHVDFSQGDLVVDCGANIGELSIYFKAKKIPVDYIGIEPAPQEYKCLKKNAANYATHNVGLWKEENHQLEFYVSSEGADSSFIAPSSPIDRVIKIPAKRLDKLLPDKQIKLLKLEAEGAEPEVLMGGENILPNIEYISADLGPERGYKEELTLIPVVSYLIARGFSWVRFNRDKEGRITCLFRNRKLHDFSV